MEIIELLQRVGLNKYESEAYAVLIREGPLTGYEVAKRSAVPLSRSYEVLERLHGRGLVLAQPGEPARYAAEDPALLIGQVRRDVTETLDQLEALLPASASLDDDGFWVVRGRANILIRARAMVEAGGGDGLLQVDRGEEDIESLVTTARGGGLTIAPASAGSILLLASGEALVGTLLPSHHCQAVVSRNSALLQALAPDHASSHQRPSRTTDASSDWLTWEWEKQRSILRLDNRRKGA